MLHRLIDAAGSAQSGERKMHVLGRIVRRVREPVIVFTEYRDTLDAIRDAIGGLRRITTLHGGQTATERRQSVHAFTSGAADLLIATDAGSEGLNLQGTCRLVVNLELPWNPIRLEQRIGRVDRIGQTRTVHAINLFAEGTAERTVLASLLRRIDRIRMSEIEIAACVISRSEPPQRSVHGRDLHRASTSACEARAAAQHIATPAHQGRISLETCREEIVTSRRSSSLAGCIAHLVHARASRHTRGTVDRGHARACPRPVSKAALAARRERRPAEFATAALARAAAPGARARGTTARGSKLHEAESAQ